MLSRDGVRRGDLEAARRDLDAVRAMAPLHPELLGLGEALALARAAAREPSEGAVTEALRAGRLVEAEAAARDTLARWPDSEVARRALRSVEGWRREAQVAALREAGLSAGRAGQFGEAERCLVKIRALASEAPDLVSAIDGLRAAARAEEERRSFDEAMRAYRDDELAALLHVWVELPEAVWRRVRDVTGDELFDHAGRLLAACDGDPATAVAASLALREVSRASGTLAPDEVLARLGPNEATLKPLAPARAARQRPRRGRRAAAGRGGRGPRRGSPCPGRGRADDRPGGPRRLPGRAANRSSARRVGGAHHGARAPRVRRRARGAGGHRARGRRRPARPRRGRRAPDAGA